MERIRGLECTRLAGVTPDPLALKLFPEEIARKYTCLPTGMMGNQLEIACLDPNDRSTISQIATAIRRPILARRAALPELRYAIDRAYSQRTMPFRAPDSNDLLLRLGHLPMVHADQPTRPRLDAPAGRAREAYEHGDNYLEAMGISAYLPHLRSGNLVPNPDLSVLVSETMARRMKLVPLWWVKDFLIAAIIPGRHALPVIQVKELPGVMIWTAACTPDAWDELYRKVYLHGPQPDPEDHPQAINLMIKRGAVTEMDLVTARQVSRSTNRPLSRVCIEQGLFTQDQWCTTQAQVLGIQYEPPIRKNGTGRKPAGYLVPASLAKALSIVPLGIEENKLLLGLTHYDQRIIRIVEGAAGMPVEARLIDPYRLNEYLSLNKHAVESCPPSCSLDELLLGMKIVTPDQLEEAQKHEAGVEESFEERLLRLGLLDESDLAEVLSLLTGIPNTTLVKATFDENVSSKLPPQIASQRFILPLEACGEDLWAAVADPLDGAGLMEAEAASGMKIWPIVAPRSTLMGAIQQVYGLQVRSLPREITGFISSLIKQELLTQVEAAKVMDHYSTGGMPVDTAIAKASTLSDARICELMSEYFNIPDVNLHLNEETTEMIDPMGQVVSRQRMVDPVGHAAAGMIDLETSRRMRVLPFHRSEGILYAAFSAPPTSAALLDLEGKTNLKILPFLAPQIELEEAIERVLGKQNLGTRMLLAGVLTRRQLNDALDLSTRTGVRLGRALVNRGYIQEEQLYEFLSEQSGLPLQKIDPGTLKRETVRLIDAGTARNQGMLVLLETEERIILAVSDPFNTEAVETAARITGRKVTPVLVTERDLEAALEHAFSADYLERSISELLERSPEDSAFKVLSRGQTISLIVLAVVSIAWLILHATSFLIVVNILATIFYLSFSAYKFYLVYRSMTNELEVPVTQEDLDKLEERDLPVYTILVPVYKEANVLPGLLEALGSLDYPSTKLDIKVLMEKDDEETLRAFYEINPPSQFEAIVVPYGLPKTKPKACNYGLIHARGEYIVIFDAEDIPEPDQLKRVLVAFIKSPQEVVCIQSKLNYYNRNQNLLTRWFTVEYSMWFDLFLPGLDAARAPIPLGGTSNHFKRDALIDAGAWDPHNVTEDADLGIRMFKRGYRTAIVDSTTYEEANSQMYNWLRQRSRWIKGYIQTWLVHMRHPIRLWKDIGTKAFFGFQFVIGGTFFAALANPLYWLLTTLWFFTRWDFIPKMFPGPIFFLGAICLYIGNFAFAYMNVAGAMRRGYYDMVKYALLSPLYWGLMSVAAWRGFGQLIFRPHFWEKTIHGLTRPEDDDSEQLYREKRAAAPKKQEEE